MTRCINLIHSLTFREYPKDPRHTRDDVITKHCAKHTLYSCSAQHRPLRTDVFTLTCLDSIWLSTNLSQSPLNRQQRCRRNRVKVLALQWGCGLCQGARCVLSHVSSTTQCRIIILQVRILRHGNANSPKVTQLRGIKLHFKACQSGFSHALHHHANCCQLTYAMCFSTRISYLFQTTVECSSE